MNSTIKTAWQHAALILVSLSLIACGVGNEQGFNDAVELNSHNIIEIEVRSDNDRVSEGETEDYQAWGIDDEGTEIDFTSSVSWSSSDTSIITINGEGVATGISNGTVDIIASMADLSGSKSLRSSDAALTSIVISSLPDNIPVCQTHSTALVATGFYSDQDQANISDKVSWVSGDASVIYVGNDEDASDGDRSEKGMLSALSSGNSVITASHEGIESQGVSIAVEDSLLGVTISSEDTDFYAEQTSQFTAMGDYGSVPVEITENVTWITEEETTVVSFSDTNNGLLNLLTEGSANIRAVCGQGTDSVIQSDVFVVEVEEPVTVTSLQIEIDDVIIEDDQFVTLDLDDGTAQVELYLVYSNSTVGTEDLADDEDTTWSEVGSPSAEISDTGLISFDVVGDSEFKVQYKDDDSNTIFSRQFNVEVED